MEKGKLISLIILGLFLTTFLVGVVSAIDDPATEAEGLLASLGDIQVGEATKTGIAKVLLMALVAMIVYSIANFIPFMSTNETVRWGISIVVAILAFLFVPMADIQGLLTTYEALGIVLTSIVPLVILFVFSVQLEEKMNKEHGAKGKAVATILNTFLFVGFLVYLVAKTLFYAPGYGGGILGWFYPATILITILWLYHIKKWVLDKITEEKEKAMVETAGVNVARALFGLEELETFHRGAAKEAGKEGKRQMSEAEKRFLMGKGRGD